MRSNIFRALLVAVVAALALSSAALAGGGGVTGKYSATIKSPAQIKGTWGVNFKKGGVYEVSLNGEVVSHGKWTATATTLTLREPTGCGGTGTYAWKKADRVLRFTRKREAAGCEARAAVLSHPFRQKG